MNENSSKKRIMSKENVLTIPNAITVFRLLLIPLFIWLYISRQNYTGAVLIIALSAISDIVDGKIARHFNMISELGKMLDPIVDKLTQGGMFYCLLHRFPHMIFPLIILAVKEIVTGIMSLIAIHRSSAVEGAEWPGKLTTALLYAAVFIHILWPQIDAALSDGIIGVCIGWMLFAFVFYGLRNIKTIRGKRV